VQPEEVIAANLRRLARLARHRLVSSVNGQWRVPADLVAELRSRDLRHPRFRTQIAEVAPPLEKQVWHRGPVWLDRARADAPYGFGADLARARADRARFLGHLGIAGSPDEALRALGALERRDFGERLAAARGLSFVERPAPGFRGRLQTLDEGGAAPRFLAVVEESVRRLALVPATTSLRALIGQVVELESGDDGRPVVRRLGHARGT
jgi:hypothetical protein